MAIIIPYDYDVTNRCRYRQTLYYILYIIYLKFKANKVPILYV